MALTVKHSSVVDIPDDPSYEVGSDEWNAAHALTGTVDATQLDQTAAYAFSGLGLTKIIKGVTGYTATNDAALEVAIDGDTYNAAQLTAYSATSTIGDGPFVLGRFAFGTPGTPLAVTSGALLASFAGSGFDGTSFTTSKARIELQAAETFVHTTNVGTQIVFKTTPNGSASTVMREVFRLGNDGGIISAAFSGAIQETFTGYSLTGTQAQSMVSWAGTLNTSGSPDVFKIAITDTARGASTKLFNIYGGASGTTSEFSIDRNGGVTAAGGLIALSFQTGTGQYLQFGSRSFIDSPADAQFRINNNAGTLATILTVPVSATLQLGAANAASPVAQTLQAQGSRAGTDSNVGGASITFDAGKGTGTGVPSTAALRSPVAVASGTGAQTLAAGITANVGTAVLTSYTVATLPAAATAGAGATAFVTDANTTIILGLGLAVTGGGANKVPVYSDGTNWLIG